MKSFPSGHQLSLRITPLGGVGEIGSNMTLLETSGEGILIDVGLQFPDNEAFGVHYLIPDIYNLDHTRITDLIITHGHEDHIGALAHLCELNPGIRIWAPPLAAALMEKKWESPYSPVPPPIQIYEEDFIFHFEDLVIHPIHVNHSIPQTFGLLIQGKKTPFSCFFVSDFKYDDRSPYERPMNLEKLKNLSQSSSLRLLLADSTCIQSQGKTPSERDLIPHLEKHFENPERRIFITFFPSNTHRLQTLIHLARKWGKKIIYLGRSQKFYSELSHSLGLLQGFQETLLSEADMTGREKNVVVLLSGPQGDFFGALRRVVAQEHPLIRLKEGDKVLFSSRTIPGNEIRVARILNKIYEQRALAVTSTRESPLHASGHAYQDDIKILVNHFRPTHYVPIHGETFLLHQNYYFIQENFPQVQAYLLKNHHSLTISSNLEIALSPPPADFSTAPVYIHGHGLPLTKKAFKERRKMAEGGLAAFTLLFKKKTDSLEVQSTFSGLPDSLESLQGPLHALIISYWQIHLKDKDPVILETSLKTQIKKFFLSHLGYHPVLLFHLHFLPA